MAERSVNEVRLIGRIGRDAETKYTPSGAAATRFALATTRSWKDQQSGEWKDETNWTNVVVWRKENLANHLVKGKQVYVDGRLHNRSYENKDGQKVYVTDVIANEIILLGGGNGAGDDAGFGNGNARQRNAGPPAKRDAFDQHMATTKEKNPKRDTQHAYEDDTLADDPFSDGITDDDVPF